jgi:predicted DNA-binding ribbon-helix-helix protein
MKKSAGQSGREPSLKVVVVPLPRSQLKGADVAVSRLVNRNVVAERGRTSMRLEPELWDALLEICEREGQDVSTLVRQVEAAGHTGGRTSAVRVFVLDYFRSAATEAGHAAAGHGPLLRSRLAARSAA